MVKNEESYIIKSFFKSFRQNFKQATVINLIMLAVATILYVDLRIVNQMGQPISQILHVIFLAFTVLYAMVFMYIYPVLAKFYNSTRNTFINAVLMSVRHLPYTVLMALVCAMSDSADLFCTDLQSTVDNPCDLSCDWWGGSGILQFIFPGKNF